jgi:2,3-bisphosphoglycerate-independent phosphoglycerate mutase
VTFFFNGGLEKCWDGEHRVLVDSPKGVATYDLAPAMSVAAVAEQVSKAILSKEYPFVVCNLAPPDMVIEGVKGDQNKNCSIERK